MSMRKGPQVRESTIKESVLGLQLMSLCGVLLANILRSGFVLEEVDKLLISLAMCIRYYCSTRTSATFRAFGLAPTHFLR